MSVDVRPVTDAHAAAAALRECAGTSRDEGELSSILARDDVHVFVAYEDGAPAGTVIAYRLPRLLRGGSGMLLYSIDVAEAHRRRGIGTALVLAVRRLASASGCDAVWLLTNASNEAAMALYAAAGGTRANGDDVMWAFDPLPAAD